MSCCCCSCCRPRIIDSSTPKPQPSVVYTGVYSETWDDRFFKECGGDKIYTEPFLQTFSRQATSTISQEDADNQAKLAFENDRDQMRYSYTSAGTRHAEATIVCPTTSVLWWAIPHPFGVMASNYNMYPSLHPPTLDTGVDRQGTINELGPRDESISFEYDKDTGKITFSDFFAELYFSFSLSRDNGAGEVDVSLPTKTVNINVRGQRAVYEIDGVDYESVTLDPNFNYEFHINRT